MKFTLLLLVALSLATSSIDAQTRKERKEQRRAEQDSIDQVNYTQAMFAISDTLLILEADRAYDQKGNMVMVDDGVNFVKIEKKKGVVQLAFPFLIGPNGVGGITLDGKVSDYIVTETKNGDINITCYTFGPSLNADIRITLRKGSNQAEASVSSSTMGHRVNFSGVIKHTNQSNHFEGVSRF